MDPASKSIRREPGCGAQASSPVPGGDAGVWRSRKYLPHFDRSNAIQVVTFRLADALPAWKIAELRENVPDVSTQRMELDAFLDAGHGSCLLMDVRIADLVEKALLHFDGTRYHLIARVVMANHVHVVIETVSAFSLSQILHSWKSFTARKANEMLGRTGVFWQKEYFDRLVRNEQHLRNLVEYIHGNPVKAGLVRAPEEWRFSSAGKCMDARERPGTGEDARAPRPGPTSVSVLVGGNGLNALPEGTS